MTWRTTYILIPLLLFATTVSLFYTSNNLRAELQAINLSHKQRNNDPLYLPESRYIKLITLGFDNFFSNLLWFNTLNYFGKQYQGEQDYRWLAHMCDITTQLDRKAFYIYEFCATTLSWMAKDPTESIQILTRGIETFPDRWRLRFLRGFNYWYFLEAPELAGDDFKAAAALPDAPQFVTSIASRLLNKAAGPESAIIFLNEMIKNANDSREKEALIEKRKLAEISQAKIELQKAISVFRERYGRTPEKLEELFEVDILKGNLLDPFGGSYYLNQESGEIETTSGRTGLDFKGKSIKTGLAAKEWKR